MLSEQTSLTILQIDNTTFDSLGDLSYKSIIWPVGYTGFASFEMWIPSTVDNLALIRQGNVVWCGGTSAGLIEIINEEVDDTGVVTLNVKGRTLEALLLSRVIMGTYSATNKTTGLIMNELLTLNFINPTDTVRKMLYLSLAPGNATFGKVQTTFQKTGGEVYTALEDMSNDEELGFSVDIDLVNKKLVFRIFNGVDRTSSQSVVDPIILSTEMNDILSSNYYLNIQAEKNVAFVMGEGTGAARKKTTIGSLLLSGFDRKELFVDARDIQSSTVDTEGNTITLTDAQNLQALAQRGTETLSDNEVVETFEVTLRVVGTIQYKFGTDYNVGDRITINDSKLGIIASARITGAQESLCETYSLDLTVGYEILTINQKIRKASAF